MNAAERYANQWEEHVIVEVRGARPQVEEFLNQVAAINPELWRRVRKIARSTDYRGRGLYKVDFQGDEGEVDGE